MCRKAHFTQGTWILGVVAVAVLVGPGLTSPAIAQCPYNWLPGEGIPGVDGQVYATTSWDPDGPGPRSEGLVVGGWFWVAGDVLANRIACWDPATSTWSALGSGVSGRVFALAVLDGRLYAGGSFSKAGGVDAEGIACWDPVASTWSALGSGMGGPNPYVRALTVLNGKLYAGGAFSTAGGVDAKGIACWDPVTSTWSALGSGMGGYDPSVYALTVLDGKLYLAGYFVKVGGVDANRIACWDPATSTWSALGSGTVGVAPPYVHALTVLNGKLYAGGNFTTLGGVSANHVACWDPATSTWSALGLGVAVPYGYGNPYVYSLTVLDGRLCAGGTFLQAGGASANHVACWDPATSTWSALGSGTGGSYPYVYALTTLGGKVYAGGEFTIAGEVSPDRIACWDPKTSTWSALGSAVYSGVRAMTVLDGKLYAGGGFSTARGVDEKGVACWDPVTSTWSALGAGMSSSVRALAVLDGKLCAGGYFGIAGGERAHQIACWDPATSTWSALGSGMGGPYPDVYALAVLDGKLYAGGDFSTAGGVDAKGIACWNPATSTWSALGAGMSSSVRALTVLDGKLYVGASSVTVSANRTACWDPVTSTWSDLGSRMDNSVWALTVLNGKLYAGGNFSTAGGMDAKGIASWDPVTSTWSALGSGMGGYVPNVYALTALDGKLYAGGGFTTAGGVNANMVACWDPATVTWSPLGSGMNRAVSALAAMDGVLYAGGGFTTAGGQVSAYFARWGPVRTPDDYDCDGVADASDNCPRIANADQADVDGDGVGDVCDACPDTPQGTQVSRIGCPHVPADFDNDGDVDRADVDQFEGCSTGPGIPQSGENCSWAKLDGDDDVDQADFAILQRCYSGENVPADPNCAN